jgi:subtilisin family serine protease
MVLTILLGVAAWSAPGSAAPGRFVPDEIIVKFRTPVPDNGSGIEIAPFPKANPSKELRAKRGRFLVREARPLVKDFDPSRWAPRQQHLSAHRPRGMRGRRRPDLGSLYRVRVDVDLAAGGSLEEVLAAYRNRPDVEYAEPNPIIAVCADPNDPLYADQWALGKIQVAEAWDTCRGSRAVVVAVIDTGVDYRNPDLQGNLWINEAERAGQPGVDDDGNGYVDDLRGYNFAAGTGDPLDDHGHGTVCAGIIGALGNNGTAVAGVCWAVRIMPLKALDATGNGTVADAVPAVYYAVANGADIISGSWGGTESSQSLRDAVEFASQEGVVIVAAAGNNGATMAYYPAAFPEVIAVAATEPSDKRWYLSNFGSWVDLAAPGWGIISLRAAPPGQTARPGSFVRMSGTSMAAPHVAGTCALLLAANPFLRRDELQQILATTGDPIPPGTCASNARLNVKRALRAVIPPEGTIRMDRACYARDAQIELLVADWDLRGAGDIVALLETAGGDQETVTLRETDASLGVLRSAIISSDGAVLPGDGILEVQDGEGIQVRYFHADDNPAGAGQWRLASAVADYQPPTVASLEVKSQGAVTVIEFQTNEPARAEIRYGQTEGGPYDLIQRESGRVEPHHIELPRLPRQTRYYFVVAVADEAGNEALADNGGQSYSFVTPP